MLSSATPAVVNAIPTPPVVPTTANVIQPTCATPSGSLVITTQTGVEYSLDGTTYQSSNTFTAAVAEFSAKVLLRFLRWTIMEFAEFIFW